VVNVANVVTISRVVLALGTLPLLWQHSDNLMWTAFGLTAFIIYADALDGYLARKLKITSKLGGILDIAGDRAVELCYWVAYSALNWIPVWVALVFIVRGTFVDAIRSALSEKGYTAFGANTMMQSGIGKFIVASNFMRFTYAIVKAVAFCLVIAAHTTTGATYNIEPIALGFVYAATAFCVVRGLPVLLESKGLF
jgi:phosphatidylglycerophosphate synthase